MPNKRQLVSKLKKCIKSSIKKSEFQWELFFNSWFKENGTPIFFLFNKNLGVTNTQYVELFSLIKLHQKTKKRDKPKKLLIYNIQHVKYSFTEVMQSLLEDYSIKDETKLNQFVENYIDIFSSTVVVDMYYSSCAVFLPYGIDINLENVVYDSGYIHSAGNPVYIRNIRKSRKDEFQANIDNFLQKLDNKDKIPLLVYSHDDFDFSDKDMHEILDKGPEQCKLYLEKMSMGTLRLSKIIDDCKSELKHRSKIEIPVPHSDSEDKLNNNKNTLWLISDKSVSENNIKIPGNTRYYILYFQTLKNSSPFYFFDENKPAWKSHTTLPHSLTASLLNISRPLSINAIICDPFSGTGTTWLEICRIGLKCNCISSDLSPATKLLHSDNALFFSYGLNKLEELNSYLNEISRNGIEELDYSEELKSNTPFSFAMEILKELKEKQPTEDFEYEIPDEVVKKLEQVDFKTRMEFYLILRAELRNKVGFMRKTVKFGNALKISLDKMLSQIQCLIEIKQKISRDTNYLVADEDGHYVKYLSTYSYNLYPSLFCSENDLNKRIEKEVFSSKDARQLKPGSCDLILCDPPYGFNTNEDIITLTTLYSAFIEKAIIALKKHGQLILCLPGESYTGKPLPYCTRSDLVSRQILYTAEKYGRRIYKPATSIPLVTLNAPYYWESDKALRRTILHFYID